MILLFLLIGLVVSQVCHPECSWACDDPHCSAVCSPYCAGPPNCSFVCMVGTCPGTPQCEIQAPPDQCEEEQCPAAAVICVPPPLSCSACEIECEQIQCAWSCEKPRICPYPTCELQCEMPACALNETNWTRIGGAGMVTPSILFLIFIFIIF
jgi:hypothetical protein